MSIYYGEFRGLLQHEASGVTHFKGFSENCPKCRRPSPILNEEGQQLYLFPVIWSLRKRELGLRNSLFLSEKTSVIEFLIYTWLFQKHIIDKGAFTDHSNENLQLIV